MGAKHSARSLRGLTVGMQNRPATLIGYAGVQGLSETQFELHWIPVALTRPHQVLLKIRDNQARFKPDDMSRGWLIGGTTV